jgi:hypothetical protein
MSSLVFDGVVHTIEIIDKNGKSLGGWISYNNIESQYAAKHFDSMNHLANGIYIVIDQIKPHAHKIDANGSYGLHGIIRFNYPGHPGIGIHSGQVKNPHHPGAEHATHGCIRTTRAVQRSPLSL